jgi:hypothetical protein
MVKCTISPQRICDGTRIRKKDGEGFRGMQKLDADHSAQICPRQNGGALESRDVISMLEEHEGGLQQRI